MKRREIGQKRHEIVEEDVNREEVQIRGLKKN